VVEADLRTIVDMDMVHAAAIGADATTVTGFEPSHDSAIFSTRWMEIHGPTRRMEAPPAAAGDAGPGPVGRNHRDAAELGADLGQALAKDAGQAPCRHTAGRGRV
jgi:hypothetical protein